VALVRSRSRAGAATRRAPCLDEAPRLEAGLPRGTDEGRARRIPRLAVGGARSATGREGERSEGRVACAGGGGSGEGLRGGGPFRAGDGLRAFFSRCAQPWPTCGPHSCG